MPKEENWDIIIRRKIKKLYKENANLNAALDKLISDSVMPHGDKDKIQKFKENLINEVKNG
jgi:hypothetical protein